MSEVFKVPAPVSEVKRCLKRPLSPKPSTSSAPYEPQPSTSKASSSLEPPPPPKQPTSSVPLIPRALLESKLGEPDYDHLDRLLDAVFARVAQESLNLISHEPGRGLRARRRNRWRRLQQAKLVAKFQAAAHALQPLLMQEVENHQIQKFLITGALDHFANTVNAIADKFEGKADSEYTRRINEYKQKAAELREKRRAENPHAAEFREPAAPEPQYSEEETTRRLREETEAAIEAILTGDKTKETLPNNFEKIIAAFKKVEVDSKH